MEFFLIANDIGTENKKKAILLSCCGVATCRLFKSLVEIIINETPVQIATEASICLINFNTYNDVKAEEN